MKERQGSMVTRQFLDRETQWMVMPFTEMGKLVEKWKQVFYGWCWGEMKIYGGLKNYFPCLSTDRVIVYSQFSNSVLRA